MHSTSTYLRAPAIQSVSPINLHKRKSTSENDWRPYRSGPKKLHAVPRQPSACPSIVREGYIKSATEMGFYSGKARLHQSILAYRGGKETYMLDTLSRACSPKLTKNLSRPSCLVWPRSVIKLLVKIEYYHGGTLNNTTHASDTAGPVQQTNL